MGMVLGGGTSLLREAPLVTSTLYPAWLPWLSEKERAGEELPSPALLLPTVTLCLDAGGPCYPVLCLLSSVACF